MPRTKGVYNNCPFGLFYLMCRGKATKWIVSPGGNWAIPFHMSILTKNGHLLHFQRLLPHEQNKFGGWWFLGSFKGVRRSYWKEKISKRGKYHVFPVWLAWIIIPLGYLILFIPWNLVWLLYGPCFTIGWGIQGVYRRYKKLYQLM